MLGRFDVAVVRSSSNRSGNAAPRHLASARTDRAAPSDVNALLHELRTERLAAMPAGAKVVLSAGCAGQWYFDWLDAAYPGVQQHIGLEAYLPRPSDLSRRVRWIPSTVRRMTGVDDSSVDLVFSGQNIEHLWAADVVGFLLESRRVLREGAWLVIDSPNAWISDALNYRMPEHVAELTPAEITGLLEMAGFTDLSMNGLWLCFDRDRQLLLPLPPDRVLAGWTMADRRAAAPDRPDDSFIWWAQGRACRSPDVPGLVDAVERIVSERYRHRLANPTAPTGRLVGRGDRRWASVDPGSAGVLRSGPGAPLPPGRHRVAFELRRGSASEGAVVAVLDAIAQPKGRVLTTRDVRADDLPIERFTTVDLALELDETAFDIEFRVRATGASALTTALTVDIDLAPSVPFHAGEFGAP